MLYQNTCTESPATATAIPLPKLMMHSSASISPKSLRSRLKKLLVVQIIILIICASIANTAKKMDYQENNSSNNNSEGNRSADGLYYGLTMLYVMNTIIGLAAVVFGTMSLKSANAAPRYAYYHYLSTCYTLFCSLMGFCVALYLLNRSATVSGDPKTSTKWSIIGATVMITATQLVALSHSRRWQRAVLAWQLHHISMNNTTTRTTTTGALEDGIFTSTARFSGVASSTNAAGTPSSLPAAV